MQISKKAIKKLTPASMLKLALALNCSEQWIKRLVKANKPNGPLTTYSAVSVIRENTGLTDNEILIGESVNAAQN